MTNNLNLFNNLPEDYYDRLANSSNPLQAFIHRRRYQIINGYVHRYYQPGFAIADFACGDCSWNANHLPVVGLDTSQKMLDYCLKKRRIAEGRQEDITKTVSFSSESVDIVVMTETLEHLQDPSAALLEVHRVLKSSGIVIISVPYDTVFSLWRPLFALLCFVQGTIFGQEIYQRKCGHIRSFSPSSLKELLEKSGFEVLEQRSLLRFIQFLVGRPRPA